MKYNTFFAAIAAFVMMTFTVITPAQARDHSRVWNQDAASAQASLQEGKRSCFGDPDKKKQSSCSVLDPTTRMLATNVTLRSDGLGQNINFGVLFATDADGNILRNELGVPIVIASHVATQANAASLITQGLAQIPAAAFNGAIASGIQAAFPACHGNCGGPQVVNVNDLTSLAGSTSNSFSNLTSNTRGACTTCGQSAYDPKH